MQMGMVGLGKMGGNMSRRLTQGGHEIVTFDLDAAKVAEFEKEGMKGATDLDGFVDAAAEAARGVADGPRRRPDRIDGQQTRRPVRTWRHPHRRRQFVLQRRRAARGRCSKTKAFITWMPAPAAASGASSAATV